MPREHVNSRYVTVAAGDLPVLAARSRADLPRPPGAEDDGPDLRRVRLRAGLSWEPGGGEVRLLLDGEDDLGVAVDLGGLAVPLDRRACNHLRDLLRRASDEANGELA